MNWRALTFDMTAHCVRASALGAALVLCAAPALAQQQDALSASAETPWYEAFTLSMNETVHPSLDQRESFDLQLNGGRWGLSLGIDDYSDARFQREDVSAGAFVNLGDRFRLGGEVRFTAPESQFLGRNSSDGRQPEIKFESALRF